MNNLVFAAAISAGIALVTLTGAWAGDTYQLAAIVIR